MGEKHLRNQFLVTSLLHGYGRAHLGIQKTAIITNFDEVGNLVLPYVNMDTAPEAGKRFIPVFTALHALHAMRSSNEKAVCPSVCPSFGLSNA